MYFLRDIVLKDRERSTALKLIRFNFRFIHNPVLADCKKAKQWIESVHISEPQTMLQFV